MKNFDLSLYLVTDRKLNPNLDLLQIVEKAVEGGVTIVQLREKNTSPNEIKYWAKGLIPILRKKQIPLIINDYPDIAKEVGASGVHLGSKDSSPREARSLLGEDAIIGLSIESDEISNLDLSEVDYLAASPVFHTSTKQDIKAPFLVEGLKYLRGKYSLPIVAIGGVNSGNLTEVLSTGVDGVAVCSAICQSHNPKTAAIQLKRPKNSLPRVLTIAGSDSGGGAGVQADLKTFQALNCYGMSAITVLTAQNTKIVRSIFPADASFIKDQLEAIWEDIGTDAIKIGMLYSKEIIEVVADTLRKYDVKNIVVDPVMISKSGDALLKPESIELLIDKIVPVAAIVTPNLPEAQVLGKIILNPGQLLVIKGGHGADLHRSDDKIVNAKGDEFLIPSVRVQTKNTHGTGCTYSAAIASYLASGLRGLDAVRAAREFLQGAIISGASQKIGLGFGPVDHAWNMRKIS